VKVVFYALINTKPKYKTHLFTDVRMYLVCMLQMHSVLFRSLYLEAYVYLPIIQIQSFK